ncbi:sigma-54 interaction domain-containing protein [Desulfonatronovibrio magnus]|uniref:sigma-54 interaction domain-containing protein n=1 Tax=Desulfonatronovibrio magnus TaxID=698827 RepID=UPI0005EB192D|nr:sigma-54-dependent Fis family transcriptional regulator [Desulfonatronovibrio magnus]RQD60268.1 MAG: sigma-54-dependent Fis family transcriptional regulator [Desulfonatronovibrio sp. MSAO_Bac4]
MKNSEIKLNSAVVEGLFDSPVQLVRILDEIPVGAALLDGERRILLINRALAALTGYDQFEARGLVCSSIIRSSMCLQQCPLNDCDSREYPFIQSNIINRQRQKIPVRISVSPINGLNGKHAGYFQLVEDLRAQQKSDWKKDHGARFGTLIGTSPQIEKVFSILPMVAQTDSSILITGESGTGKDVVAEAIHLASDRAKEPFVKVNCAALPETLLESELFGHQKGAFTGATENKPGRFRLAHNGTIFLTEVGDLPTGLQSKLLTFLDDKTIFPLGSTRGIKVDVRIIAATLRPLEQMVSDGNFRSDLLFRLNVVRLHLPPLREREGDIRILLEQMLRKLSSQLKKNITDVSQDALQILLDYHYPGNVRELKNILEYAVNVCQGESILTSHLPEYVLEQGMRQKQAARLSVPVSPPVQVDRGDSKSCTWEDMEKKMILEALVAAKGRKSKAADILGWGRSTLWRKLKKLGLE